MLSADGGMDRIVVICVGLGLEKIHPSVGLRWEGVFVRGSGSVFTVQECGD